MNLPKHIAVIIDGNRRWATKHKKTVFEGHKKGLDRVEQLIGWCKQYGIKELTVFTLSIPNLRRSPDEVGGLFRLFRDLFKRISSEQNTKDVRVKFIGDLNRLPNDLQKNIHKIELESKNYKKLFLNIAIAYDGHDEIRRAIAKMTSGKDVGDFLDLKSEPDLIIRTGGTRLSGFLLWQCSYSELVFLPNKLWPDFIRRDFINCVLEFGKRKRNFGK